MKILATVGQGGAMVEGIVTVAMEEIENFLNFIDKFKSVFMYYLLLKSYANERLYIFDFTMLGNSRRDEGREIWYDHDIVPSVSMHRSTRTSRIIPTR